MVRIITDSAADFEPWELEEMRIQCIPLTVIFGDTEYHENENLTKEEFYSKMWASDGFPKTSQPSPQILMDLFGEAVEQGDEAIYITISSALSGVYQSAVLGKRLVDSEDCFVVDSRNATGGQRILVQEAVKLRDQGKTAEQIAAGVKAIRDRIVLYACMDTLEYLYLGGRISHTTYKLGTLANIKPIITVDSEGRVQVPAKAMGMRKGMDFLCKRPLIQAPDTDYPFYVMYTNNREVAQTLVKRLEEAGISVPEEQIIQVGAAIGSHIGPEACGLVYVRK